MRWTAFWATAAMVLVMAPITLLFGTGQALACSCAGESEAVHYERADTVFAGRLVHREEPPSAPVMSSLDPATLTFEVSRVYKGEATDRQRVTTAQSGASCGLEIEGEGPFLVFAERDGAGLTASLCGGTRPLDEGSASAYGSGKPPASAPGVSAAGVVASAPGNVAPGSALVLTGAGVVAALGLAGSVVVLRRRGRNGLR